MGKVNLRIALTKWAQEPTETEYVDVETDFDVRNGSPRVLSIQTTDVTLARDNGTAESTGYVINQVFTVESHYLYDNLVVKLLTYIEATFTDPEQRKAHKDIVKQIVYDLRRSREQTARDTQR